MLSAVLHTRVSGKWKSLFIPLSRAELVSDHMSVVLMNFRVQN